MQLEQQPSSDYCSAIASYYAAVLTVAPHGFEDGTSVPPPWNVMTPNALRRSVAAYETWFASLDLERLLMGEYTVSELAPPTPQPGSFSGSAAGGGRSGTTDDR